MIKAHKKEQNRQRYLEEQKKKLTEFRNLENSSPNGEVSQADTSERDQYATEDPMRVRGSFYLAKPNEAFARRMQQQHKQSKSPRQKKVSPNRLGFPKKKAKLKLAPLGPRGIGVNNSNQPATIDEIGYGDGG